MLEIKTFSPKSHKIKCLIYGASGNGKTTFAGTAENVLFLDVENGLLSIADKNVDNVKIESIENFLEMIDFLEKGEHKYKTVVLDSITELNNKIKLGIEKRIGGDLKIKEWGEVANTMKKVISRLNALDMNVIILAQEQFEKDGDEIKKIIPNLNGKLANDIGFYMDVVGYVEILKDGSRKLITSGNDKYISKDRTNKIGDGTELNFEKWLELISKISLKDEEIKYTIMSDIEKKLIEKKTQFEIYKKELNNCKKVECLENAFKKINKDLLVIQDYKTLINITKELKETLTPKDKKDV